MYVTGKEASKYYSVGIDTLRRWDKKGKIKTFRTKGGHRRYFIKDKIKEKKIKENKFNGKIIYTRVSSTKQSEDLQRQIDFLVKKFPKHTIVKDIGSGINFKRQGFNSILDKLFKGEVKEVVVASKDRFSRFGFELFEQIFERFNAKLKTFNSTKYKSPEQELSEDLLSIITVFSARYYGSRKYKDTI